MADLIPDSSVTLQLAAALTELMPEGTKLDGGLYGKAPEIGHPVVAIQLQGDQDSVYQGLQLECTVLLFCAVAQTVGVEAEGELEEHWSNVHDAIRAIPWVVHESCTREPYTPGGSDTDGSGAFLGFRTTLTVTTQQTSGEPT